MSAAKRGSALPAYPKPGPVGGKLIRKIVGFFRQQNIQLPIASDILIATSGGSDSTALAHLLVHYGRRIVSRSSLRLIHINHGWRGSESDQDEAFVQNLADRWRIPFESFHSQPPLSQSGQSWEEQARDVRKKAFDQAVGKTGARIFTAHQADDVAETVLWRLFTGAAKTHGGGIAFSHGCEIRPTLIIRKSELKDYLDEVGQSYREDSTNSSGRFLRSKMRQELLPGLERIFPRAVEHLLDLALSAQEEIRLKPTAPIDISKVKTIYEGRSSLSAGLEGPYTALLQAAGLKVRRSQLELLGAKAAVNPAWYGEIHLSGGWKLLKEKTGRWILEKV